MRFTESVSALASQRKFLELRVEDLETHSSKYHIPNIFVDFYAVFSSLNTGLLITTLVFGSRDSSSLPCSLTPMLISP